MSAENGSAAAAANGGEKRKLDEEGDIARQNRSKEKQDGPGVVTGFHKDLDRISDLETK